MIQSCNVTTPNHTSILVVCTLAINSNVSGLVVVENERTNETLKKPLSQTRSVIFTGLEPGVRYRVRAYDDASSSTAAYEQSLFLNNIIPSPSCLKSSTIFPTGIQLCCSNAVACFVYRNKIVIKFSQCVEQQCLTICDAHANNRYCSSLYNIIIVVLI